MDLTDATATTGAAVGSEAAAPTQDADVPMSEEQNQRAAEAAAADDNDDDPVEDTPSAAAAAAAATASSSKGPGPGDAAKCVKCMKRYGKSSKCS